MARWTAQAVAADLIGVAADVVTADLADSAARSIIITGGLADRTAAIARALLPGGATGVATAGPAGIAAGAAAAPFGRRVTAGDIAGQ